MKKQISVEKAIKTGKLLLVNFFLIWIICMSIGLFTLGKTPIWVFLTLFFGGFLISALITLSLSNRWKLWAFENVSNVHEFKKRVTQIETIPFIREDDEFFNKVENSTEKDKRLWNIKQKFSRRFIFEDDLSVPSETSIYYSKVQIYFFLFITVFLIVGLVYYVFTDNSLIIGITTLIVTVVFLHLNRSKLKRERPQIILNNKGIETISTGFTSWKNIKNEQICTVGTGKHTKYHLKFRILEKQESVLLTGLNIGIGRMEKLLYLYRSRYEQQNK
jgi:hypothetical protein